MNAPGVRRRAAPQGAARGLPGIEDLYRYTKDVGAGYGTEDFSFFLYALVKMHKPGRVLELGTGTGASSFWIARGLLENGSGSLLTIDDGSHWEMISRSPELEPYGAGHHASHRDFILAMAERLGVRRHLDVVATRLPPFPVFEPDMKIDLLFTDYQHDPAAILALLSHFLPSMAEASSILIDSAPTSFASYLLLERVIEQFNAGQVPGEMLRGLPDERRHAITDAVRGRRFTLVHLTEAKDRAQNGTSWLKLEPVDILPHPLTTMR